MTDRTELIVLVKRSFIGDDGARRTKVLRTVCPMSSGWKPLAGVDGVSSNLGPYEGIPGHLKVPLDLWCRSVIGRSRSFDEGLALLAVATLHVELSPDLVGFEGLESTFWMAFDSDADRQLQLVHFLTHHLDQRVEDQDDVDGRCMEKVLKLERVLEAGSSVWAVAFDGSGLTRRVDATTKAQLAEVLSPNDAASEELREAWSNAYTLNPDPSDCWDHSIKAVEALLKPIVLPRKTDATVGHVVGELTANLGGHPFGLHDQGLKNVTNSHETLVGLLRLVWVNPDRHQGDDHRTPSIAEARGVLAAAITIAQWAREGLIK